MNAIERGLSRPIPLDKAASFFIGLKSFGRPSQEDDELMAECVKQAAADRAPQKTPIAEEAPADSAQVDPHPFLNVKDASLRFTLLGRSFMKTAGEETAPSEDASAATMASPTPAAVPAQQEYLANEQAGMAAEEQSAVQYYQARLEEARAQAAAAQEAADVANQQLEQMTAEQESHQQQLSSAQQEGQIAQQAALQQVETANQAAVQAMQQSVGASNQALQAKGQEAAAKIEVQAVRSQLFDMASQGLPGTEPDLGGAGGAAEGMEPLAPQEAGVEEGMPAEEGGDAAAEGGEAPAEGGEAAPDDGSGEVPTTDAEQGATASSDGVAEQEEAPAPEGTPAEATPDAVPPGAGGPNGGAAPPQAAAGDETQAAPKKSPGQISIKVGTAQERRAKLAAALPELFKTAGLGAAGIGAIAGGALGAGAAGLEAAGHGPDLDKMRSGIAEREAAPKRQGLRGFADAMSLVQEKARLGLGEATRAHPIPATITGGIAGAAMGASAGPRIADLVREAASAHRGA